MLPFTRAAVILLAGAGLGLAGCGDDDDGPSDSAFCVEARAVDERFQGVDPTAEEAAGVWRTLGESAPEDLVADVELIADTFDKLAAAGDDPEQLEALQGQAQAVADARLRIETHLAEECEVSLSSADDTGPETVPTAGSSTTAPGAPAPTTTPAPSTTTAG